MKAFLLAAGLGTRLKPLTETTPKCMLPINGRPMLDIWLDHFAEIAVDEVLVNLHHLPASVDRHLAARQGPPATRVVYEPDLLGSAGTLAANREWVQGEDVVLVCNADNLTDFDLRALVEGHRSSGAVATVTIFHAERPSACGIVEIDERRRMIGFCEKPARPVGDLANAGMYAFNPCVFDEIEEPPPRDIGFDLLPRLVGRAHTIMVNGYFRDIGTVETYERAQNEWPSRKQ